MQSATLATDDGPFVAFRHRDFRLFQSGRFLSTVGTQMQGVAVGWQIYALTGQALNLGLVGLAQFLPAFLCAPFAGHAADRFDRRIVLVLCHAWLTLCSLSLYLSTHAGPKQITAIYAALVCIGVARGLEGPSAQALLPNLVPREHFQNAVVWSSSVWQIAVVIGPALGGILYGVRGASQVYAASVALEIATVVVLLLQRSHGEVHQAGRSFADVVAGVRYVWKNQIIFGAISLDLFAVLFGGAVALLPVFAHDILHTGPRGLGLLRSAPAGGAFVVAIALAYKPIRSRAGILMLGCVALFGLATIVFGVSSSFGLSLLALAIAGGADMVSVFVRQTLVLLNTPDDMRGRVAAVSHVFIGASNELGEFESGLTAAWFGSVPAVIIGGIGTCLVVLVWAALFPALRKADQLGGAPREERDSKP
ncbi:MAG TPA: MFS transporter [Polyangiaceae bacterium]|jgi:MFS family permease